MQNNSYTEDIEKVKKTSMLFILGKERSGTSLLQNLLDANPQIIGGPESKFMVLFYPRFGHKKNWKRADIVEFVKLLYEEPLFFTFWHLDAKQLTETLLLAGENADYALLCKMVYYQMRKGKEDVSYISDKNPEHILHIDTLLKIFPDAKFIHIVREPRDNIYSQITSFKIRNVAFRAYQWVAYNSIVEKRKQKAPQRYITLLYETLVSDTEATMKKICNFLEIPFSMIMTENKSPEWLNAHLERNGIVDKEKIIHRNLLKPLDDANIGKWKNKMDPRDQTITEVITGEFASKTYGYQIDGNSSNKPVNISSITILKGKWHYYMWQKSKELRFKSLRFNMFYSKLKRRINKNVPIWEYF